MKSAAVEQFEQQMVGLANRHREEMKGMNSREMPAYVRRINH